MVRATDFIVESPQAAALAEETGWSRVFGVRKGNYGPMLGQNLSGFADRGAGPVRRRPVEKRQIR
jgi:hypothetical protein